MTGAGSGLGKYEAIALARAGASVVVNDLVANDAVEATLEEIRGLGAQGRVRGRRHRGTVHRRRADGRGAEPARQRRHRGQQCGHHAGSHAVQHVRRGLGPGARRFICAATSCCAAHAAAYWRGKSKEAGAPVYGRIVNTSSEAGLLGPEGQANYGAAKAGITALTLSAARGLSRYGVRANAICPRARTSMTENVFGEAPAEGDRSVVARARGRAGRLPRIARRRLRQRSGLRRLRPDGGIDGGTGRGAALRRRGRSVDTRCARGGTRELLRRIGIRPPCSRPPRRYANWADLRLRGRRADTKRCFRIVSAGNAPAMGDTEDN